MVAIFPASVWRGKNTIKMCLILHWVSSISTPSGMLLAFFVGRSRDGSALCVLFLWVLPLFQLSSSATCKYNERPLRGLGADLLLHHLPRQTTTPSDSTTQKYTPDAKCPIFSSCLTWPSTTRSGSRSTSRPRASHNEAVAANLFAEAPRSANKFAVTASPTGLGEICTARQVFTLLLKTAWITRISTLPRTVARPDNCRADRRAQVAYSILPVIVCVLVFRAIVNDGSTK